MPSSPLKRPSASGGRLRRLLASLRPPARAGPLPVQTGFPTSLADIVVKNHGRLRNPRRRHRSVPVPAAAAEPVPTHDAAAPVPARPGKGAAFSIQPGLLAAGGAVALALLVIWSEQLLAAATIASVALSWIESVRTVPVRGRRPETEEVDSRRGRGRGSVSPIREAAESLRPCRAKCESESAKGSSEAASLWSADADSGDLGCDDTSSAANSPKGKQSRRSLRTLLANKLQNGNTPRATDSHHGGEANAESAPSAAAGAPAEETPTPAPPPEAIADDDRCGRRRGRALPLPALVPIILAGLVAGKLPALALAVLCAAFSSSVERLPVPVPVPVPASGDPILW